MCGSLGNPFMYSDLDLLVTFFLLARFTYLSEVICNFYNLPVVRCTDCLSTRFCFGDVIEQVHLL